MKSLWLLLVVVWAPIALGDVITLNDGTRLVGAVQKTDEGWVVTDSSGKQTTVTADQIKSFEVSSSDNGANPGDDLAALRSSVNNMSSLAEIVERYQKFIDAHANTPVAGDAQADLDVWKQRQAENQVKVNGTWMTPQDRQKLVSQETAAAADIRDMLEQGRAGQADQAIQEALGVDPTNPSVLYLEGYELASAGKVYPARTAFEKVIAAVPDHAPTLNNLAVVLFKQTLTPAAMNYYCQAMEAEAGNKEILDNVAEALHALSAKDAKSTPAQHAAVLFAQQDADLAKRMATQGLYRWGATWVTQQQLQQCQAVDAQNKDKLAQLQADFDSTNAKINTDQADIQTDQQQETQMQTFYTDGKGRVFVHNDTVGQLGMEQNINQLEADIQQCQAHLAGLRQAAKVLDQNYPVPRYTGIQQLIGPEGTPLLDAPAAQPQPLQPQPAAQ